MTSMDRLLFTTETKLMTERLTDIIIVITIITTRRVSVTVTEAVSVTGWPMHGKQT